MHLFFRFSFFTVCFLCCFLANAQKSNYRRVLLFVESEKDSQLLEQQRLLKADEAGCKIRDIRVETFVFSKTNKFFLSDHAVYSPRFTFLLIGKDGSAKFRSTKVISKEQLFAIIDAMPMRKKEMKRAD